MEWLTLPSHVDYAYMSKIMEERVEAIIAGNKTEIIYLLEHQDVYTAGSSYDPKELLDHGDINVIYSRRGGKFTYHGPGQRVIYPLIKLSRTDNDVKLYVRQLENWIIASLARVGLAAQVFPGKVGIWVYNRESKLAKIGAIGIRVKKWVAYHGIAVNVNTNLEMYKAIIPCGISDFPVTSLYALGIELDLTKFDNILKEEFTKIFL